MTNRQIWMLRMVVFLALSPAARADDGLPGAVGHWRTIDGRTGRPRSIVRIAEVDGELRGRIEKLLDTTPDDPNPICRKCSGEKRNRPLAGLEVLWGFRRLGDQWGSGNVLDPESGHEYAGDIRLLDGGRRLSLYGYTRIVVKLGRTEVWERVEPAALDAAP